MPVSSAKTRSVRDPSIHDLAMSLADGTDELPVFADGRTVRDSKKSGTWRRTLCRRLDKIRSGAETDPFSNSIDMLALDISRHLRDGSLSMTDVDMLVQRLTLSGFSQCADRISDYLAPTDPTQNDHLIEGLIRSLAGVGTEAEEAKNSTKSATRSGGKSTAKPTTKPLAFEVFQRKVESELFGIVFTAHPTFGLANDLLRALCQVATRHDKNGRKLSDSRLQAVLRHAFSREHAPEKKLTLDVEHALSLEAIANLQAALRRVYAIVFKVAQSLYGPRADELVPRLISVASWVGYDVDGRSDISWADTLHKRLQVQLAQLKYYRDSLQRVSRATKKTALKRCLGTLESRLSVAIKELDKEIDVFRGYEAREDTSIERIRTLAKKMHKGLHLRLTDTGLMLETMNSAITLCRDLGQKKSRQSLNVLRAEIALYGLGMAHTHVRINASQLHNAIRKNIGMTTAPEDPKNRQTYLKALEGLLLKVRPATINFGSIMAERMSGKRLFMIVAQMLKYVDEATPVRFLIAECESAFTLLTALYLAKQFNVDDRVDISPLFETARAMSYGHRIIDDCLQNPEYRAYVRRRGRICVQTGFSDAGRYLGQTAASLSIENLQRNIARVLAKHDLEGVQLLFFDTHGESIGRGGHPVSLRDRLEYVSCPYTRRFFRENGVAHIEEITFQGGDGYRYFMNPVGAYAVVTRILQYCIEPDTETQGDLFYQEPFHAAEMVNTVKQFNAEMMDNRDYAALLGAFGTNMTRSCGSRPVIRQHEGKGGNVRSLHPSQTRAIPQNSILQQVGMLAIPLGGIGQVWVRDSGHFEKLLTHSPRFRRVMRMVEHAFAFSEIEVFRAYINCFDPGMWLARAARTGDGKRCDDMKALSMWLEENGPYESLIRVYRILQREYVEIRDWLLGRDDAGRLAVGRGRVMAKNIRDDLLLLHGVRIALIQELFLHAMRVPEFNFSSGYDRDNVIAQLINLDVPAALNVLTRVFPLSPGRRLSEDFGETATYQNDDILDYRTEHREVFAPMARLHACICRISTGIQHFIGAVG